MVAEGVSGIPHFPEEGIQLSREGEPDALEAEVAEKGVKRDAAENFLAGQRKKGAPRLNSALPGRENSLIA